MQSYRILFVSTLFDHVRVSFGKRQETLSLKMSGLTLVRRSISPLPYSDGNGELRAKIAELTEKNQKQHELIVMKGKILQKKDTLIDAMIQEDLEKTKIKEEETKALYQALEEMQSQLGRFRVGNDQQVKQQVLALETALGQKDATIEEREMQVQVKVVEIEKLNTEIARLREQAEQNEAKLKQQVDTHEQTACLKESQRKEAEERLAEIERSRAAVERVSIHQ
jgi:DNA repair exonuclease SbcCD ATPase subunit